MNAVRLALVLVRVRRLLDRKIAPEGLRVVRPDDLVCEQVALLLRQAVQHAVQKRRCLGAGEVAFRTEHRFAASFHPAIAVSLADRILGPVAGNVGERRVGRLGSLVKARDHRGEFRARDGCVRTERAVGIAADDTHLRERGHRRGVPRSIRHIAVSVVLRQILHAHIVLEQAEEHGRHLGAADASVRANGAILVTEQVGVMILAVEHFRNGRKRYFRIVRLCGRRRGRGSAPRAETRVIGRSLPDSAVRLLRNERKLSRKQRAVGTVPAVKLRAALRLRGRTVSRSCYSVNGLRLDSHRAELRVAGHVADRHALLFPDGVEGHHIVIICKIRKLLVQLDTLLILVLDLACRLRCPAHESIALAAEGTLLQRMSLPVREGLVLHRTRSVGGVGVIAQHILLQTEPRHIAAVLVASGRALFRRIGHFVCQGMLPLRIVPADKHTAFSRHSRRAARRAGLGIERLGDHAVLRAELITFRRIELDRTERSRFRRVGDGHIGQFFPLRVEGDRIAVHNLNSPILRHLCKRRFISIGAPLPLSSGRILRPASKHIPPTLKFVLPEHGRLVFRVWIMELLRQHLAGHITLTLGVQNTVAVKFDSKAVARKHGDIVHHELLRERVQLLLHHGRGNSQGRAVDCTFTHRLQFAVVVLFTPADKMVALTRSRGRGNGISVYLIALHRKAAALWVHIAPVRIVDGKVHRCHVFVLIYGVELYFLSILRDFKFSKADGIAGGLRLDITQVSICRLYKAPTGEILVIRDFCPGRKLHQLDRRAEGNAR